MSIMFVVAVIGSARAAMAVRMLVAMSMLVFMVIVLGGTGSVVMCVFMVLSFVLVGVFVRIFHLLVIIMHFIV